jgi:hypothetical protein
MALAGTPAGRDSGYVWIRVGSAPRLHSMRHNPMNNCAGKSCNFPRALFFA